MTFSTARYLG